MIGAPFPPEAKEEIGRIKDRVRGMLQERQSLAASSSAEPSAYWSSFCSYFDYMLGMSDEAYAKLRLHTYHLTSDNYQTYFFHNDGPRMRQAWDDLIKDTPSRLVVSEPPDAGIGFDFDGRLISNDLMRYQHAINSLHRQGVLEALEKRGGERKVILEIGGGYGGMALHLSGCVPDACYIIVDLPEVLLFSSSYLSLLRPSKRRYIYDAATYQEALRPESLRNLDFVFLPNFRLSAIDHVKFDLVVNASSLQEMRTEQAVEYLDFISSHLKGSFYSWNQNRQPENKELKNLSELIEERFEIVRLDRKPEPAAAGHQPVSIKMLVRKCARRFAMMTGLIDRPPPPVPVVSEDFDYHEYLCRPRGTAHTVANADRHVANERG